MNRQLAEQLIETLCKESVQLYIRRCLYEFDPSPLLKHDIENSESWLEEKGLELLNLVVK